MRFRSYIDNKFHYWGFIEKDGNVEFVSPPNEPADIVLAASQRSTNLKDIKEKEIFEGDWIKSHKTKDKDDKFIILDPMPNKSVVVMEVIFQDQDGFYLKLAGFEQLIKIDNVLFNKYEVIGNCFEGPDSEYESGHININPSSSE